MLPNNNCINWPSVVPVPVMSSKVVAVIPTTEGSNVVVPDIIASLRSPLGSIMPRSPCGPVSPVSPLSP